MLKRFLKFGFFASLLMCSVVSVAQAELMDEEPKPKKELGAFDLWHNVFLHGRKDGWIEF